MNFVLGTAASSHINGDAMNVVLQFYRGDVAVQCMRDIAGRSAQAGTDAMTVAGRKRSMTVTPISGLSVNSA